MYNLYENIHALCKERKITPGGLCGELGFRRSVLSDLKNGRKKSLDTTTLIKIAEYFGVSVDYLLTGEETKNAPTPEDKRNIDEQKLKVAFFRGADPTLTDEEIDDMWDDAKDLRDILIMKKRRDRDGK